MKRVFATICLLISTSFVLAGCDLGSGDVQPNTQSVVDSSGISSDPNSSTITWVPEADPGNSDTVDSTDTVDSSDTVSVDE